MTSDDPTFRAFSSFSFDEMPLEAVISRRKLRRLEDIDDATTAGLRAQPWHPASSHMRWSNSRHG
jgi:hypothetical protein